MTGEFSTDQLLVACQVLGRNAQRHPAWPKGRRVVCVVSRAPLDPELDGEDLKVLDEQGIDVVYGFPWATLNPSGVIFATDPEKLLTHRQ